MKIAATAARIVEKSLVSDRIIADTVIANYCDQLLIYRRSLMLKQDTVVEIHSATMDGWVMQVRKLLQPVANAMMRNLVIGLYLQADATAVNVHRPMATLLTTQ